MKGSKESFINLVLLLTLLVVIFSCAQKKKPVAVSLPEDTIPVFILNAKKTDKSFELPSELIPYFNADIFAKVEGFVKEMRVDIGDKVRKGEILAVIDAPEVITKYAEYEVSLNTAKARYETSEDRWKRLYETSKTPGAVAPFDLDNARNQLKQDSSSYYAAKKLAQTYKALKDYLIIHAPFDGVVTTREVDPGDLVNSNTLMLTVQFNTILRLRVAVPEIYIATNSINDTIRFRIASYPGRIFKGILARKSASVDPKTRTEQWEFDVDNSNLKIEAGSFAYALMDIKRADSSLTVPFSAVVTNQEQRFVIKIENGKAERIPVKEGISNDSGVEIYGNLTNGDTLVYKAKDEIRSGYRAIWKVQNTTTSNL